MQALLAGEIQFDHVSPAPILVAWAQGADLVWIGTTTHQMVFTLLTDVRITKGTDLKGKNRHHPLRLRQRAGGARGLGAFGLTQRM